MRSWARMKMRLRVAEVYLMVGFGLYVFRGVGSVQDFDPAELEDIFLFIINTNQCQDIGGTGEGGGDFRFINAPIECGFQQCRFPSEVCTVNADFEDFACTLLPAECTEAVNEEFDLGLTTQSPLTDAPTTTTQRPQPRTTTRRPVVTTEPPLLTTTLMPGDGKDWHQDCCFWAGRGECQTNARFMCPVCQSSCQSEGCTQENYYDYRTEATRECVDFFGDGGSYGSGPPPPPPPRDYGGISAPGLSPSGASYAAPPLSPPPNPGSHYGSQQSLRPEPLQAVSRFAAPTKHHINEVYPKDSYYVPSSKLPLKRAYKLRSGRMAVKRFAPRKAASASRRPRYLKHHPRAMGIAALRRSAQHALQPKLRLGLSAPPNLPAALPAPRFSVQPRRPVLRLPAPPGPPPGHRSPLAVFKTSSGYRSQGSWGGPAPIRPLSQAFAGGLASQGGAGHYGRQLPQRPEPLPVPESYTVRGPQAFGPPISAQTTRAQSYGAGGGWGQGAAPQPRPQSYGAGPGWGQPSHSAQPQSANSYRANAGWGVGATGPQPQIAGSAHARYPPIPILGGYGTYRDLDLFRSMLSTARRQSFLPPLPQASPFVSVWQPPAPQPPRPPPALIGSGYGQPRPQPRPQPTNQGGYGQQGRQSGDGYQQPQSPPQQPPPQTPAQPYPPQRAPEPPPVAQQPPASSYPSQPRPSPSIQSSYTSELSAGLKESGGRGVMPELEPFDKAHQWTRSTKNDDWSAGVSFGVRRLGGGSTTETPTITAPPLNRYGHRSLFADVLEPEDHFHRFVPSKDEAARNETVGGEAMERAARVVPKARNIFDFSRQWRKDRQKGRVARR